MVITKASLPRRTVLRGMGTVLALPLLDAMVPALTATVRTAAAPARRVGFYYVPQGAIQQQWFPTQVGTDFEWSPSLSPLAPFRDKIVILSGLAHLNGNSFGDGGGDHPRASAVWLSAMHAWGRSVRRDIGLGTTADQFAAREFGKYTVLPSLEMTLEAPSQIACDTTDCFYASTISWRTPTTPNPMEGEPRAVFERLFGARDAKARRAQLQARASILDSVTQEVNRLERTLGPGDRSKLREYTESVREIERRIQVAETENGERELALPNRPDDILPNFDDHARMMFDLQHVAFQADITRVASLMIGREGSGLTFPFIGVKEGHHTTSHHSDNPDLIAKKAKIDTYQVQLFAYFLEKLRATPDGDGTLLDHSLLLYGSGIGDGNTHSHTQLPCLLAGGADGRLKGGRHLASATDTPMANVLMSMLDMLGVPMPEKLGDSTGRLTDL